MLVCFFFYESIWSYRNAEMDCWMFYCHFEQVEHLHDAMHNELYLLIHLDHGFIIVFLLYSRKHTEKLIMREHDYGCALICV